MGRRLLFETEDELKEKIDGYWAYCGGRALTDEYGNAVTDKYGKPVIVDAHVPTVTGLTRFLGFKSRQALLNYQGRARFRAIIEDAKLRIQEYAEERLFDRDGVQGAKFTLCNNFGWSEKQPDETEEEMLKKLDKLIGAVGHEAE